MLHGRGLGLVRCVEKIGGRGCRGAWAAPLPDPGAVFRPRYGQLLDAHCCALTVTELMVEVPAPTTVTMTIVPLTAVPAWAR